MDKSSNDIKVYGKHVVLDLLKNNPKLVRVVFVRENENTELFKKVRTLSGNNKIHVNIVSSKYMDRIFGDVIHQGIGATLSSFEYTDFEKWSRSLKLGDKPAVFLLNELQDPHNVGAIIRSAAAFGINAVIISKDRQVPVNSTVIKTSQGAVFTIPIIQMGNINQSIKLLKEMGFWIASFDTEGKSNIFDEKFDAPFAFIIGNEGIGVRKQVKENSDFVISVPIDEKIESLNASVTAGVVAYEWARQRAINSNK